MENETANPNEQKQALNIVGKIFLCLISLIFWRVLIPILFFWYIWKKSHLDNKKKVLYCSFFSLLFVLILYWYRAPRIISLEPEDGFSIQAQEIVIKGSVNPKYSIVTINDSLVDVDNGIFSSNVKIPDENNIFIIKIENGGDTITKQIVIKRIFTEKEIAIKKAEQIAWDNSRAGIICKKYSELSKDACKGIEVLGEAFCKERQGDYKYGIFLCSGCVNLNDFIESETVHNARGPAKQDDCEAVAKWCLDNYENDKCLAIAQHKFWIGMSRAQLLLSLGVPQDTNDTVGSWGIHTQWVYGDFGPYIYLQGKNEGDLKVTSYQK